MRVIGVIDLVGGRAVHARGGRRARYQPVTEAAGTPIDSGDAIALARVYLDRLNVTELYAADLDAILHRHWQEGLVRRLAGLGAPLWLDAGIRSRAEARRGLALGAARVVVGLETLPSYTDLDAICRDVGGARVGFSLDLRCGEPVVAVGTKVGPAAGEPASTIALRAARAGVGALMIIDLARVGGNQGLDLALIARLRSIAPGLLLVAGGGVRGLSDLERLADIGCEAALVATALLNGELTPAQVSALGPTNPPRAETRGGSRR
jgi:phosphoribosylformimino-5-aminoimidazole carboxamide ribotide isomerase